MRNNSNRRQSLVLTGTAIGVSAITAVGAVRRGSGREQIAVDSAPIELDAHETATVEDAAHRFAHAQYTGQREKSELAVKTNGEGIVASGAGASTMSVELWKSETGDVEMARQVSSIQGWRDETAWDDLVDEIIRELVCVGELGCKGAGAIALVTVLVVVLGVLWYRYC